MTSSYLQLTFKPLLYFSAFVRREYCRNLRPQGRRRERLGLPVLPWQGHAGSRFPRGSCAVRAEPGTAGGLPAVPPEARAPRPRPYSCGDKSHREGAGLSGAGCGAAPVASARPTPRGISRVTTTRYQMSPGKGVAKGTGHPRLKTELRPTLPGLPGVTPASVLPSAQVTDRERGH